MITPGFETTDPFTQTRFVVIQGAQETTFTRGMSAQAR